MSHKSFLTLSIFLCFFGSSLFIYAMNDEDHQYPVFLLRKNNEMFCGFTPQASKDNLPVTKEELSRFVQTTVLESLSRLHDDIPREERSFNAGSFRTIFDDEDSSSYKKLDTQLIHSLVDSAPEKLKFIIKLYANPRSFILLSKNSCFKNKFLFYGLPGAGKSSLAKAFADYCGIPRQFIVGASLLNQYQHSGQQNLRELFEHILSKRNKEPRVVIFDEFAGIARTDKKNKRNNEEETLSVLLNILDQIENLKNIIFIATTNKIKHLPPQITDRFSGSMFEIRHPNNSQNLKYLNELDDSDDEKEDVENDNKEIVLSDNEKIKFKTGLTANDKKFISSTMANFSCRDRNEMRDTARLLALREYIDEEFNITQLHIPITKEHLLEAIQEIKRSKQIEAPSNWKWYKKRFKEYYPLILSTVQVIGGLGLQYYGIKQQANFAEIAHNDQMALMTNFQDSQMKFYERTHEQQVSFQNQVQADQVALQNTIHAEQMTQQRLLQEKASNQQLELQKIAHKEQLEQIKNANEKQLSLQRNGFYWQFAFQVGLSLLDKCKGIIF